MRVQLLQSYVSYVSLTSVRVLFLFLNFVTELELELKLELVFESI